MPRYDFACAICKTVEERTVSVAEIGLQSCSKGHNMVQRIDFDSIGFICYAQDSIHDPKFTGPRQKARWEKENGMWDVTGESKASVDRQHTAWKKSADEKRRAEVDKAIDGVFQELGGEAFTAEKSTPQRQVDVPEIVASASTPDDLCQP